jgi:hypothetical protein
MLLVAGSAHAMGFGAYFDYGRGWGSFDSVCGTSGCITNSSGRPWDRDQYGVGFLLDTNASKDTLFNYRLNVGYQRTNEVDRPTGQQLNLNGLMIRNTFGFGLVRTERMRFFLGPVIRLGFQFPDTGSSGVDVFDFDAGVGVALGLNFHVGDSLSLTVGPVYEYLAIVRFPSGTDVALISGEHVLSVNLGIMFRSASDRFVRR